MQDESPHLLDQNVNEWFSKNPERRMIRVLDGKVRAFLSDRYRRLDNLELCATVLPVINEMKNSANAVTAASKIAKSYERATNLERIGGEILSLPVPQNILPPPSYDANLAIPEYQTISV